MQKQVISKQIQKNYLEILQKQKFNHIKKFSENKQNLFLAERDGKLYFCKFHEEQSKYEHQVNVLNLVGGEWFSVSQYKCNPDYKLIYTTFQELQSLQSYWIKHRTILKQKFIEISTVLIDSISELKEKNLYHFDLNLSNIVGYSLKIVGLSGLLFDDYERGDPYNSSRAQFVSPQRKGVDILYQSQKVEIYSLGVILLMIYLGKPHNKYWKKQPQISQQQKLIFESLLQNNPNKRGSIEKIKKNKHLYKENYDKNELIKYLKQLSYKQPTSKIAKHQNAIIEKYEKFKDYCKFINILVNNKQKQLQQKNS